MQKRQEKSKSATFNYEQKYLQANALFLCHAIADIRYS